MIDEKWRKEALRLCKSLFEEFHFLEEDEAAGALGDILDIARKALDELDVKDAEIKHVRELEETIKRLRSENKKLREEMQD